MGTTINVIPYEVFLHIKKHWEEKHVTCTCMCALGGTLYLNNNLDVAQYTSFIHMLKEFSDCKKSCSKLNSKKDVLELLEKVENRYYK